MIIMVLPWRRIALAILIFRWTWSFPSSFRGWIEGFPARWFTTPCCAPSANEKWSDSCGFCMICRSRRFCTFWWGKDHGRSFCCFWGCRSRRCSSCLWIWGSGGRLSCWVCDCGRRCACVLWRCDSRQKACFWVMIIPLFRSSSLSPTFTCTAPQEISPYSALSADDTTMHCNHICCPRACRPPRTPRVGRRWSLESEVQLWYDSWLLLSAFIFAHNLNKSWVFLSSSACLPLFLSRCIKNPASICYFFSSTQSASEILTLSSHVFPCSRCVLPQDHWLSLFFWSAWVRWTYRCPWPTDPVESCWVLYCRQT